MNTESLYIGTIPALVWGEPSERLVLAVHGNMSHKGDTVIELLAEAAGKAGCQVLSFDLPEHGDRREAPTPCKVQVCVGELERVLRYAQSRWKRISLFGCSLGAYFSLMAFRDQRFEQALFLSPVVDMERLIHSMMSWSGVTPEQLERQGEIRSGFGQTLYWDYYCYVREHPVDCWDTPTDILYGGCDNLSEREAVDLFAAKFGAHLEVVPGGEHFFHTEEQLRAYCAWLENTLKKI